MEPAGNGNYKTDQQAVPATQTRMLQGKVEGSNVQSVLEMTRMIDVSRDYQSMQRMIQSEHDRLKTAIERLLRA
jgi:flagellar basal-body rod protein FlgF